jgi:hypothetical protein
MQYIFGKRITWGSGICVIFNYLNIFGIKPKPKPKQQLYRILRFLVVI